MGWMRSRLGGRTDGRTALGKAARARLACLPACLLAVFCDVISGLVGRAQEERERTASLDRPPKEASPKRARLSLFLRLLLSLDMIKRRDSKAHGTVSSRLANRKGEESRRKKSPSTRSSSSSSGLETRSTQSLALSPSGKEGESNEKVK